MKELNLKTAWVRGGALVAGILLCAGLLSYGITEEVPLGGIQGLVTMSENGRPLANATVVLTPLDDGSDYSRPRVVTSKKDGSFSLRNIPAGDYSVEVSGKAHSLEQENVTVPEGHATVLELELKPHEAYLDLYTSQRVFAPTEVPVIEAHGFGPEPAVTMEVVKLDLKSIISQGGVNGLVRRFRDYEKPEDPKAYGKVVETVDHTIEGRDAEGTFINYLKLPSLPEGFYWIRCSMGKMTGVSYLNVSKIALVSKTSKNKALCYVADIVTGQPIAGASVAAAAQDKQTAGTVTGAAGTAEVALPQGGGGSTVLVATFGNSAAVVDGYGGGEEESSSSTIFCYTDRPIYRPGDKIQFKGLMRDGPTGAYRLPAAKSVKIEIRDPDDSPVTTMDLPVDAHGTFHGEFSTNRETKPGAFQIVVNPGDEEDTTYVNVAAYRKPEYTVKVKSEQRFYVIGQHARAAVECEYYFGGPVVGAKVSATITRTPLYEWNDEPSYAGESGSDEEGSEGDYSYGGGELVQNVEATTDANGRAIVEFETKPENDGDDYPTDYSYRVDVYVADSADKYFEGSGSVNVMRGSFGLQAESSDYIVRPNQPVQVKVNAFSHDGHRPLAGKNVRVLIGEERWQNNASQFIERRSVAVTTGPDGSASVPFTPTEGGDTVFKAVAKDDMGNEIESRAYVYVEGGPSAGGKPVPKLTAKLDKKSYSIGDSAKLMIQSDHPGGSALVTFDGETVLGSKIVPLTDKTTIVPFEVDRAFAPNVSVSVAYVREKQFSEASSNLVIDLTPRKLTIEVLPDRADVQPGQTVTYTLRTRDAAGKPVPASLSLGVVDESIYAIKKDRGDILESFYPRRSSGVSTSYSFPEIYLDGGDKGGGDIPVRSKFADTAFWAPSIQTNAAGEAQVTVTLPDNLTTWRATAFGITDDSTVGKGSAQIVSRKPLMVRLSLPSFMTQKDKQQITATITNNTGRDAEVNVLLDGTQIWFDGKLRRTVTVSANKPETVTWTMSAPLAGHATVTAKAWIANGPSDGVQQVLDIQPHGRLEVEQGAGDAGGTKRLTFSVRPNADTATGRLVLNISPSVASSMVRSLDKLVGFPYGCVEQTMSRFMPSILVDKALRDLGVSRPDLQAMIPKIAADGYTRLAKMQHGDGGWGWWENDDSDPFMTCLVLDGMRRAKDAGYGGYDGLAQRGLQWIKNRFKSENIKKDSRRDRIYMTFALASWGMSEDAQAAFQAINLDGLTAEELALAVLALDALGAPSVASRDEMYKRLIAKATRGASIAHWPTEGGYSWGEESTGLAMAAVAKVHPEDPILPAVARYLMIAQRGEGWASTRDTSYVLMGLTEYLRKTQELSQQPTVRVSLNGRPLGEHSFVNAAAPDWQLRIPIAEMTNGDNVVTLETGPGQTVYYSTDFRQSIVRDQIGQVVNGNGLTVTRTYRRMEARHLEDGTMRLMPSEKPIDEARSGEVIQCQVTITSDKEREFVMVESPIPSNCRITERENPEYWDWWWSQTVVLDDRASFFIRRLPAGTQVLTFSMRAESPGECHALPTTAGNMYDPADSAATAEYGLRVNR